MNRTPTSSFEYPGHLVAGFVRQDPPQARAFAEPFPTPPPKGGISQAIMNKVTKAMDEQRLADWNEGARIWNAAEGGRIACTPRWHPIYFPSTGLLTTHGGGSDSWRSFLQIVTGQWIWNHSGFLVADASGRLGDLADFCSQVAAGNGRPISRRRMEEEIAGALWSGGAAFDTRSAEGCENLYHCLFGYVEGASANTIECDFPEFRRLVRDVVGAIDEDGVGVALGQMIAAFTYLVDSSASSTEISDTVRTALGRLHRRIDGSKTPRTILDHLELLAEATEVSRLRDPGLAVTDGLESAVITSDPPTRSNRGSLLQRLSAEYLLSVVESADPNMNVVLVFGNIDDHAAAFLNRLSTAAMDRHGSTIAMFPRFDGNVGAWATKSEQRGPLVFALPDPDDAERASRFFGRDYSMKVTQVSHERGAGKHEDWTRNETRSVATTFGSRPWLSFGAGPNDSVSSSVAQGSTEGGGWSTSESTTETSSRVHEFRLEPETISNLGPTVGVLKAAGSPVPFAVETFPPIWTLAEQERYALSQFEREWSISPDELLTHSPTYSAISRLTSGEFQAIDPQGIWQT